MFEHPLRLWRKQNGVTLMELANVSKTTPSSISRIENGKQLPSLSLLVRLVNATNRIVKPDDFFTINQEAA
jgi:hypothetical protein